MVQTGENRTGMAWSISVTTIQLPEVCKNCGERDGFFWFADVRNAGGAQNGRIRLNEVVPIFVLGCEVCSETLQIVDAGTIAELLTKQMNS